jgi:hypothetical protein
VIGVKKDKFEGLPLFQSAHRDLTINFEDFPDFSDFLKMMISAYGHRAELMEVMSIPSLSDFSQRLNGDPHDPNKITFKDRHVDAFLKKSNWYRYFKEWFEYQERKHSKTDIQKKAEMFDQLMIALKPMLEGHTEK